MYKKDVCQSYKPKSSVNVYSYEGLVKSVSSTTSFEKPGTRSVERQKAAEMLEE